METEPRAVVLELAAPGGVCLPRSGGERGEEEEALEDEGHRCAWAAPQEPCPSSEWQWVAVLEMGGIASQGRHLSQQQGWVSQCRRLELVGRLSHGSGNYGSLPRHREAVREDGAL